jgi:uncharacterized protein YndB with AHSA1/START domain
MHGRLEKIDGRWQLQFIRKLPHPPEKVWRALTEPEHLVAWFPTTIEGERVAGAALRFAFPNDEAPTMHGEMITYAPPSVLEFRWGDDDTLRFDLQPDGNGTVLSFLNTFDEVGKAARDGAGWHACFDVLAIHLAGEDPPWKPEERWEHVHPDYIERFGPEASTVGPPESHDR